MPASMLASAELDDGEPTSEPEPTREPDATDEPNSEDSGAGVSETATRPNPAVEPGRPPKPNPNPSPKPTPTPAPNNPFAESGAWSELVADGDPWAAAVMRALRSMKVPAWAGKLSTDNPFGFRLRICKDGRVDRVLRKRSTGDADLDATLEHEISRIELPPIPSAMASSMKQACMVLDYEFNWLPSGVR
jgi:hypothetical protein